MCGSGWQLARSRAGQCLVVAHPWPDLPFANARAELKFWPVSLRSEEDEEGDERKFADSGEGGLLSPPGMVGCQGRLNWDRLGRFQQQGLAWAHDVSGLPGTRMRKGLVLLMGLDEASQYGEAPSFTCLFS